MAEGAVFPYGYAVGVWGEPHGGEGVELEVFGEPHLGAIGDFLVNLKRGTQLGGVGHQRSIKEFNKVYIDCII